MWGIRSCPPLHLLCTAAKPAQQEQSELSWLLQALETFLCWNKGKSSWSGLELFIELTVLSNPVVVFEDSE